jgi:alkylation response protein AidB-like acyl-CoA dehydrogenase
MLKYPLSEGYSDLESQVEDFVRESLRPLTPRLERDRIFSRVLAEEIAKTGWTSATYGPEYGGLGYGHDVKTYIVTELSRASGAAGGVLQAGILGAAAIVMFGSEEQKKTYLPAIASGDCIPTIATSEKYTGGDILAMETTAERSGDSYVLNGGKVHVGNGGVADIHVLIARTGAGVKDLSAFIIDTNWPGVESGPPRAAMGLRGFDLGEVILRNCRVPAANRLGEEGAGLAAAHAVSILYGRPNLAATALGIHHAALDAAVERASVPRLAGKSTVRQRLGQIRARLITAQAALSSAVRMLDRGEPCDDELNAAKLANTGAAEDSVADALKLHGAPGLYEGTAMERVFRDAHLPQFAAGTDDVQRIRLSHLEPLGRPQMSETFRRGLPPGHESAHYPSLAGQQI